VTVPITIIAGYLGSGKTTLINRILSSHQSMRDIAVLVNDFGQVNIDAQLIRSVSPDSKVYALQNGCVCCSIENDLATTLDRVKQTATRHVLIEASGIGQPVKLRNQCNYPGFVAGTCWVMVDAINFTQKAQDKYVGSLVKEQVATADALIISKRDRAPEFQITSTRPVYQVDDPELMATLLAYPRAQRNDNASDTHTEFATRTLSLPLTSPQALSQFVKRLPDFVERVKGVVATDEGNLLVQRAGTTLDLQPTLDPQTGLVLIFPALLTTELEQFLRHHAPQSVHGFLPDALR
jgi:G3E family GTPase